MNNENTPNCIIKSLLGYALLFLFMFSFILIIFYAVGYAPFGDRSLAYDDGYWQYMDFFAFYKDVLKGIQSPLYSLSNGLGQTTLPVLMYYLSSPWNLIILFFKKTELHQFFDILDALKIACSSVTCVYYLKKRFNNSIEPLIIFSLSVSYALMQYNIAQSMCPMWLDGVYMLPLIMLGVYRLVWEEKYGLLTGSALLAVLFNWYTGSIDCLFSILFFFIENSLYKEAIKDHTQKERKRARSPFFDFCYCLMTAALLSMFIMLPLLCMMRGSTRGGADLSSLRPGFLGNPFNVITNYSLGALSRRGTLSLFSGPLVLTGTLCFVFSREISLRIRILTVSILGICILSCYWKPLFWIFSLFQESSSYYYRFSYVSVFLLVFCSACYFSKKTRVRWRAINLITLIYLTALLASTVKHPVKENYLIYLTMLLQVAVSFAIYLHSDRSGKKASLKIPVITVITLITVAEMGYNAGLIMKAYPSKDTIKDFSDYQTGQEEIISDIRKKDPSSYRITQTAARAKSINSLANLNEAMGFNYWGIETYTSTQDSKLIEFYEKTGYRVYFSRLVEKAMSIISIDSLLGVKYILSPYPYEGMLPREDIISKNEKRVYENPYSFPLMFKIKASDPFSSNNPDPFLYQNELFCFITGNERPVFIPAEYSGSGEGNTRTFSFNIPDGNYALYGNIPWKNNADANLDLNGRLKMRYSIIHSIGCFYIPVSPGDRSAFLTVTASDYSQFENPEFFLLDLDYLKEISSCSGSVSLENQYISSTKISGYINASKGECLFTSIPYAKGWHIKRNGTEITPLLTENCLIMIPLSEGENEILMEYHLPYLLPGIILTLIGIVLYYRGATRKQSP